MPATISPLQKPKQASRNLTQEIEYHRTEHGDDKRHLAVGHTVLIIVYTLLTRQQPYQDLGAVYFDQREQHRVERRLVQWLERLGYEVSLQPRALAS